MSETIAKVPAVNREVCIGASLCEQVAPAAFELDDDGLALVTNPADEDPAAIQDAIDACPVKAMHWQ